MAQQTINVGTAPNDGTGTPLRTAFQYTNSNFSELYTALGGGSGLPGASTQVLFNNGTNIAGDAGLVYNSTTDALTIGGNVQAASATITGDLTVATDRLKVVTGSTAIQTGATTQLQVGTTSWPSSVIGKSGSRSLFGNAGEVIIWNESAAAIGNYSTLFVSAKTGAGATTMGGLQIRAGIENASNSDGFVSLWTSNNAAGGFVERYKIDSTGISTWSVGGSTAMTLNSTGLNIANGNVILGTSGKGIDFSATSEGSGTMTSELLNDYEEGTFTPVIVGTTAAGVGTYTSQVGRYTKVGRLVSAQLYLNWTAHTGTGNMLISGLPFSSQNVSDLYNAAAFGWVYNISLTAGYVITGYVSYNTPFITLEQYPAGGGLSIPVPMDATGGFIANVSYIV